MEKIKCITFDMEAQNNLPKHIKEKMKKAREQAKAKQLPIHDVVRQSEQFYCDDKLHLGKEMCKNQCTACNDYQSI